ncbi:RNA polymerase sigma factor [Ferrimicrobium sp.]|uniref:RNA polymerase sigma factor n=1 Tax=Ferrimicrobium sp. TaxID=2926050 RepID=UPI002631015D|nr:RNA polymerase sigma factor [Ferrimicrobium sp.]
MGLRHAKGIESDDGVTGEDLRYEIVVGSLLDPIYRFYRRRVGPDVCDDLTVETFAVVFSRLPSYSSERGALRPWVFGIAANVLRHHWRDEQARLAREARLGGMAMTDTRPEDPGDGYLELDATIAGALLGLNDEDRLVLLLYAWEELSPSEIAQALALPAGTVRSRLSRVRARLREELMRDGGPSGTIEDGRTSTLKEDGWTN